jgi:hypothetical protein
MGEGTKIPWRGSTIIPVTECDGGALFRHAVGGPRYAGDLHERPLARSLPTLYAPDFASVRLAPGRMVGAAKWSDLRGKPRPDEPWLDGISRMIFVCDRAEGDEPIV